MIHTLLLLAVAALPAANPMSLPEGVAKAPALAQASALAPAPGKTPSPFDTTPLPPAPAPTLATPAAPDFTSGSSAPSPWGLAGAGLLILALAAATLWMQKRKRGTTRHIQVVETASLGPKRSLALVVVGRQSMLLSCCDAGIFLVSSQPATPEMLEVSAPVSEPEADRGPTLLFQPAQPARITAPFMAHLAEAEETQGLRQRLSEAGVLR